MERFTEGDSCVVVDDSQVPLYFAAWFGVPTESIARSYIAWSTRVVERAVATSRPCAIIVDSAGAERPPAKVRAAIAEMTEHAPRAEKLVSVYVSLPNALVRGAVTAMQWVSRKPWPMTVVSSVEEGTRKAVDFLHAAGGAPPLGFDPARYPRLTR